MADFSRLVVPKAAKTVVENQQQKESVYWRSFKVRFQYTDCAPGESMRADAVPFPFSSLSPTDELAPHD
jgi:hypothetical protein